MLRVRFTVPTGRRVYIRATLSGFAGCGKAGQGECRVRVVVNGEAPTEPETSDFGHVRASAQDSQYAANSVQFYTTRKYPAGTNTITAQASFPSGAYLVLDTDLLTVDEIAAS